MKRCGLDVLQFASGDSDIPLQTRVRRANSADAEATCKGICETFGVKYIPPTNDKQDKVEVNDKEKEENTNVKYIKVKVNELNIRSSAYWEKEAISGIVKKCEAFTVIKKIKVVNSYMHKLKSVYFITAESKYVESIVK